MSNSIYKTEMYSDDFNRNVLVKTNINSDDLQLIGSVLIKTPEHGNLPIEFPFEGDDVTIESAFETFDEVLQAFVDEKKAEQASNLVVPNNPAPGEIITDPHIQ